MTPDHDSLPVLLDVSAAAAHLGIPEGTLRRLVAERDAPCVRIGGRYLRFTPEHLHEIVTRWEQPAKPLSESDIAGRRWGVSPQARREIRKPSSNTRSRASTT